MSEFLGRCTQVQSMVIIVFPCLCRCLQLNTLLQSPHGFFFYIPILQLIASFFGKPIFMAIYWCLDQQGFIYNTVSVCEADKKAV